MPVEYFAALICVWLASYFVHSTMLLVTAWLVTRRLPSRFDRLAELVWRLALGLPVITAVAQQLSFLPTPPVVASAPLEYTPAALTVSAVPTFLWLFVAITWVAGAVIGLMQLGLLQRSLRTAIRRRTAVASARLTPLEPLRGVDSIRVSVAEDLPVPLALTNEVCVPTWVAEEMPADEFRAVIAHELAHVRRRDAFWRPLVATVTRLFFFQPLNWIASARLRELSECICDEEAIVATKSTVPLASALQAVAVRTMCRPAHLSLVPAMDSGKSFTLRRVVRILSGPNGKPVSSARSLTVLAATAGIGGVLLAPRVTLPSIAFVRYTINAADPAGHFTLTMEKGKVIGATIAGRAVGAGQLTQRGRTVRIVDPSAGAFSLQLTPGGGVSWNPRNSGS